MAEILLLQSDPRALAVLRGALEVRYRCRQIRHISEIDALVPHAGPRGFVLDAFDPRTPVSLSALRRLRRTHPAAAIIIASQFTGREMELYHLGRISVDGVLRLEEDPSARKILRAAERAISTALARVVVRSVGPDLPTLGQEAVRQAIELADTEPGVSELAHATSLPLSTLRRELRAQRISPPRTLLLWGRLIQATHLLERPYETVEAVAFRLGYASGGALRKALSRHVGCNPTTLLKRGGLAWTLEAFQRKGLRLSPPS